ncbi:MAG: 2-5 ligase [Labilithrix sp.]|nr:2-5 ligase [Labilithrix sp.]
MRGAPRLSSARWAAPETLHTTLRFFGSTDEAQLVALRALVGELATGTSSWAVRAPCVHGFPDPKCAHVLVLDIADSRPAPVPVLATLAARAEAGAVALGFEPETRAYHAHLTLARMRKAVDVSSLAGETAPLPAGRVTAITLYASTTGPSGSVYTPLERAVLPEG